MGAVHCVSGSVGMRGAGGVQGTQRPAGVGMEALNSFQGSANPAVTHEALSGGQLTP